MATSKSQTAYTHSHRIVEGRTPRLFVDIKHNGEPLITLDLTDTLPLVMIQERYVGRIARYYFLWHLIDIGALERHPTEYSYFHAFDPDALLLIVYNMSTKVLERDITDYIHSDEFPTDDERDDKYHGFDTVVDAAFFEYLEELDVLEMKCEEDAECEPTEDVCRCRQEDVAYAAYFDKHSLRIWTGVSTTILTTYLILVYAALSTSYPMHIPSAIASCVSLAAVIKYWLLESANAEKEVNKALVAQVVEPEHSLQPNKNQE